MNGRRPEQVHYTPPARRGGAGLGVGGGTATVSTVAVIAPPPPPPAPQGPAGVHVGSYIISAPPAAGASPSGSRNNSPKASHRLLQTHSHHHNHHHHNHHQQQRFEHSTAPPLRPSTTAENNMHSNASRGRIPASRRDGYELVTAVSPRIESRDPTYLYRSDLQRPSTKYPAASPIVRNRGYEDKYSDIVPPFRSKGAAPPPGWMNAASSKPPPQPIRILRRDGGDAQRGEFVEEHVTRQFVVRGVPPATGGKAQYVGDHIHQLAPSTSLEERCHKYIDTLHPDRPDPPVQDEPYEYPYTEPCDPSTLPPPSKNGQNFTGVLRRAENYVEVRSRPLPPGRRRKERTDYELSSVDDCARRMYRLHT